MGVFLKTDGHVRVWWRVAFWFFATTAGGMLATSIAYEVIALTPLVAVARENRIPLAEWGEVLALLIGTYATLRVVDGVRDGAWDRVGFSRKGLAPRKLLAGLAAGSLAILVPCGLLLATGRLSFDAQPAEVQSWWAAARDAIFLLTPAALAEELALRGYLLGALIEGVGVPFAIAITSVLFALLHLFNPDPTFLSTGMVAVAGLFLATIRLTTGSLWAAWVAHLAWNLGQAVVLHAPVSGLPLATPGYRLVDHGPVWLTGGPWGPEGGLAAAAGMLVATFLLVARAQSAGPLESAGQIRFGWDPPWRRKK